MGENIVLPDGSLLNVEINGRDSGGYVFRPSLTLRQVKKDNTKRRREGMTENSHASMTLPADHQMMKAWNEWQETDEFKNALRWAVEMKYDDGRPISDINREQHAKGAMWLAFTKGIEVAAP